jgi:hypothetical protein
MAALSGVVTGLEISVAPAAVMRRMGMGSSGARCAGRLDALVARGIEAGRQLIVPAAVCATLSIERCARGIVSFRGTGFFIRSADVAGLLAPCARATLIGATAGRDISSAAGKLMDAKAMTEAMILDAYGSEAVEAVVEAVVEGLGREAGAAGFTLTRRFSPGYGDWPLSSKHGVLDALAADRIGIAAGPECILAPEKSVTAVLGWVPRDTQ